MIHVPSSTAWHAALKCFKPNHTLIWSCPPICLFHISLSSDLWADLNRIFLGSFCVGESQMGHPTALAMC